MSFIRKTYVHLAGAVGLFVVLSTLLYQAGIGISIVEAMAGSRYGWMMVLGAFMITGYLAQGMARSQDYMPPLRH